MMEQKLSCVAVKNGIFLDMPWENIKEEIEAIQ